MKKSVYMTGHKNAIRFWLFGLPCIVYGGKRRTCVFVCKDFIFLCTC